MLAVHATETRWLIRLWFAADFVLALAPLYWRIAPKSRTGGVPTILVYLFVTGAFIAASIVWAYLAGRRAPMERR